MLTSPSTRWLLPALALLIATLAAISTAAAAVTSLESILRWESLGPDIGGRVTTVAGVPQKPFRFYAGTVGGGILRTDNAGQDWQVISTKTFGSASVGAIAVAPSDPDIVYAGMGESTQRMYMSTIGDGVYKSTDGGDRWVKLGLDDTRRIGAVVVHPQNPGIVYVAAMGHSWSRSEHRGVYRSNDGGATWNQVLYVNDTTSATDLVMDARDPDVLYVSMWDNLRSPWYLGSGGPGSAIYKTTDGGATWRKLTNGLPPLMGKIGIAVSPADSQRVYALVEAEVATGGLYVSRDGGESWRHVNNAAYLWGRPWYYMHVHADPLDADRVYVLCTQFWRSDDAGERFVEVETPHGDNHALWINPVNTELMVSGNDGGATVTFDGGKSWSTLHNQRTGQFNRVAVDHRVPYSAFAAQQDWSTVAIRNRLDLGGPAGAIQFTVGGGEAGYIAVDPFDQDLIYAGSELGFISRFDRRTGTSTTINPYPRFPEGVAPKELQYRYQVSAPIVASRHTPGVLYHAANVVLRSPDRGQSWQSISPDLTRNEPEKQGIAGGPFTNERIDAHNTLASFEESPLDANVLWAGSDDGLVHVTMDGGRSWRDVTPLGTDGGEFHTITASPSQRGGAYASLLRHRLGDLRPHLFRTQDFGATWTRVSDGLPQQIHARVLREDPKVPTLLYAGTEQGVYVSFDAGGSWRELSATLPTSAVTGIVTAGDGDDLVISTEGTGLWVLRSLGTLRQIAASEPKGLVLFEPARTWLTEGTIGSVPGYARDVHWASALIDFHLSSAQAADAKSVRLRIVDTQGATVRTLLPRSESDSDTTDLRAGLNRVPWDLRRDPGLVTVEGALDGTLPGARVPAGHYRVQLVAAETLVEQPLEVAWNPGRSAPAVAAVEQKQATLRRVEGLFTEVAETTNAAAAERKQLARSDRAVDRNRAAALADWERNVFDRRLLDWQRRIDYGGGLLFDLLTLHEYVDSAETPIGAAFAEQAAALDSRWRRILAARP